MSECRLPSPRTRMLCTMGRGHAGPHKAGGPYHSVEDWVTPCESGCTFHGNREWDFDKKGWRFFEECIHCGLRRHEAPSVPNGNEEHLAAPGKPKQEFGAAEGA